LPKQGYWRHALLIRLSQPAIPQHGTDIGILAVKTAKDGVVVLTMAARQDELSKTIAIGPRQASVGCGPVKGVIFQHMRPQIAETARSIAARPNILEITGAIARRDVFDIKPRLSQRQGLECIDILLGCGGGQSVPLHPELGKRCHIAIDSVIVRGKLSRLGLLNRLADRIRVCLVDCPESRRHSAQHRARSLQGGVGVVESRRGRIIRDFDDLLGHALIETWLVIGIGDPIERLRLEGQGAGRCKWTRC